MIPSITMEQAIAVCKELFPNVSWQVTIPYVPGFQHGRLVGTMESCDQYLEILILITKSVRVALYQGSPDDKHGKNALYTSDSFQLGEVDPAYDLGCGLKQAQRQLTVRARLNLIFCAYQVTPHTVNEALTILMWQHPIDEPEEGMK